MQTAGKAQPRAHTQYGDVTVESDVFVVVMPGDARMHDMHVPDDNAGIIVG